MFWIFVLTSWLWLPAVWAVWQLFRTVSTPSVVYGRLYRGKAKGLTA